MCAIAGIFDLKGLREISPEPVRQMCAAMHYRGPDDEGFFTKPGVCLGHRRLAIIDVEGSKQPFRTASGNSVLTYNGEIYNFKEIAQSLKTSGHTPRSQGDTEILAEGLERAGHAFLQYIRGMFSFAFYNEPGQSMLLARDRLGEKPLYYTTTNDGLFVFASDLNGLIASGLVDQELDPRGLADYFYLGYVPAPRTIYKSIKKLRPGERVNLHKGFHPKFTRYWRPQVSKPAEQTFEQACEDLQSRLDTVVKTQMISDVPLGAFLSGGADSASIVAAMAQGHDPITACTIGFDNNRYDETDYAAQVAAQYEVNHLTEETTQNLSELIDPVASAYGEPFADSSALPSLAVCAMARRHVKVALSGDGGDEVFAGYRRYPFFLAEEKVRGFAPLPLRKAMFGPLGGTFPKLDWAPRPLRLKTTLQSLASSQSLAYLRAAGTNLPERAALMLHADVTDTIPRYHPKNRFKAVLKNCQGLPLLTALQLVDFETWLPERMLTKIDRASMANSLEVRPPLLDHTLVEWAFSLPPEFKLGPGPDEKSTIGKRILKKSQENRLSHDILYRKKQGFDAPISDWLRDKNGVISRLHDSSLWRDSGVLDTSYIETMIAKHRSGRHDFGQELWSVIMFDAFLAAQRSAPGATQQTQKVA